MTGSKLQNLFSLGRNIKVPNIRAVLWKCYVIPKFSQLILSGLLCLLPFAHSVSSFFFLKKKVIHWNWSISQKKCKCLCNSPVWVEGVLGSCYCVFIWFDFKDSHEEILEVLRSDINPDLLSSNFCGHSLFNLPH